MFSPEYLSKATISKHKILGKTRINRRYIRDVQESILILVLLVNAAHKCSSRRQHFINKDENGLLGGQLNALSNHIDELADCKIRWDEVLLLIDSRDVRLLDLLANNLSTRQSAVSMELGNETRR